LTDPAISSDNDETIHKALTSKNHLVARQGSADGSHSCYGVGVTCATCYGPGYIQCPSSFYCYNPNVPTSTCSVSSGSGSGSGLSSGLGSSFDFCYDNPSCAWTLVLALALALALDWTLALNQLRPPPSTTSPAQHQALD
jgi:hypothetical protein